MSMKLEVDSWDYKEAVKKVDALLEKIRCGCQSCSDGDDNLSNLPSGDEIVDVVIETII